MKDAQVPSVHLPIEDGNSEPSSNESQRNKIAVALGRCIRTRGYASTSLTDIAITAGMSPSLMRYYFETKEEILEAYYRLVSDRIMADLIRIERVSPEQWLKDFTQQIIVSGMDKASLSTLIEVFAVAVHYEPLAKLKSRYDAFMERIYLEFFQWSGTQRGLDPRSAARMARTIELGIKLDSLFHFQVDPKACESVFLSEMRRLSGLGLSRRSTRKSNL